jgi:SAM-dependent methyltransferase
MTKDAREARDVAAIWAEDVRAIGERGAVLGRELCSCDYPYHALWGLLRVAGVTGSLRYEEDALAPVLAARIDNGTRILIAGSADTGTLCAVGRASGQKQPDVTVVDRCPAPLALIDEFATAHATGTRTLCQNLLELDVAESFDVVLINYTLSYIPSSRRVELFQGLASVLVPGGSLICATKLLSAVKPDNKNRTDDWAKRAFEKIRDANVGTWLSDEELKLLLRHGASARISRRSENPTLGELEDYVSRAGLIPGEELKTARERALSADGTAAAELDPSIILTAVRAKQDPA